ncbi:MAG: Smr/MutS family protein [Bacteroidaceae bacterium]|nr:Smr/MutS family protein [Bacteroidaceae bacterium]
MPLIYPQNFEKKIGFDVVRHLLHERCLSPLGIEKTEKMKFSDDYREVRQQTSQTAEFLKIIETADDFPAQNFFDVRPAIKRIRIEGTHLDEHELFDLKRVLDTTESIVSFLGRTGEEDENIVYPALYELTADVAVFPQLSREIDRILDKFGRIKDNASPQLAQIRAELSSVQGSISRSLANILRAAQNDGYVEKDVAPTMRDGRLVIPVAPGLKRKIKGIVHDESATGKTVFIEPTEVVEANNRIRELEGEERREINRILTEFSNKIRPHSKDILGTQEFIGEIDFVRAKALVAQTTHAVLPNIENKQTIIWNRAIHPILRLSLEKHGKSVVPLDIELTPSRRILIISGPNAGGKSVCLKTVGLLQYMLQCGLLVPMDENSRMGIFQSIMIDIGDEQSIEDDLSTYSSHLLNMKNMMRHSGGKTLLLIDEFGGGTEPQIGGAMAEAILRRFNAKKAFGVITTHYQNLKHFADENEGVVNGAMLYDRHEMKALFQLQIGNPGSSFAVEIARKIGIPEDVIKDASEIVGSEYIQSDKYLQDIVRDKRYWEQKRQNIHKREKQMEQTIERYETEIKELRKSRKEILTQAKEEAQKLLSESNAKIENTIKTIKEAQAEREATRSIRKQLDDYKNEIAEIDKREKEDKIARKMEQLMQRKERQKERKQHRESDTAAAAEALRNALRPQTKTIHDTIAVGSYVRIKGQTAVGIVSEIKGKNAIVAFGVMRTQVKIDRLEMTQKPKEDNTRQAVTFVSRQTQEAMHEKRLNFKQDIDVRGMRGDEALQAVTYFIDDAIQLNASRVRILHGTGTGALRTIIRQYLQTVPGVASFRDEHVQFGGAGITVVEIE